MVSRWEAFTRIYSSITQQRWFKWLAGFVAVWSLYDVILSQFIPDEYAKSFPKAWQLAMGAANMFPWWGWFVVFAAIFYVGLLEYVFNVRRAAAGAALLVVPATPAETSHRYAEQFATLAVALPTLGNPIGPITEAAEVHQLDHDEARIIFLRDRERLFVLRDDASRTARTLPHTPVQDGQYHSIDSRRAMFPGCPSNRTPPSGGVAALWSKNPSHWEWIGWLKWAHIYQAPKELVSYQAFEHGFIFGPLITDGISTASRKNDDQLMSGRFIAVSVEDGLAGKWESIVVSAT